MAIYFAHSMKTYKTLDEEMVLKAAREELKEDILNPADLRWEDKVREHGGYPKVYLSLVMDSTGVLLWEHQGHIGRGAYEEANYAFQLGKKLLVYRDGKFLPVKHLHLTKELDWKVRFATVEV